MTHIKGFSIMSKIKFNLFILQIFLKKYHKNVKLLSCQYRLSLVYIFCHYFKQQISQKILSQKVNLIFFLYAISLHINENLDYKICILVNYLCFLHAWSILIPYLYKNKKIWITFWITNFPKYYTEIFPFEYKFNLI